MKIKYTAAYCTKNEVVRGRIHGAVDDNKTLCGYELGENWWILKLSVYDPGLEQDINCPICLRVMRTL